MEPAWESSRFGTAGGAKILRNIFRWKANPDELDVRLGLTCSGTLMGTLSRMAAVLEVASNGGRVA